MINGFKNLLKDTGKSALLLYKIMIPISIGVKLLQYLGWIDVLGNVLAPIEIGWLTRRVRNRLGDHYGYKYLRRHDCILCFTDF